MIEKKNIFLIGPICAGKSSIGLQLAKQLKVEFYDSDREIEKRTGADIGWIFDVEGEKGFRDREEKIINELTKKYGIVLSTGGGAIKSQETRSRLSSRGLVIYLKITVEKQLLRIQYDKKRPIFHSKDTPDKILKILAKERNHLYKEIADITVCTDSQSIKAATSSIIQLLNYS